MDVGPLRDLLTIIVGVMTGALSASFGIGGAVLSTPAIRALGATPFMAIGSTLPAILPGAITGTRTFARAGLVDWRAVRMTAPAGVIAAVAGALLARHIPGEGHLLMLITALMLGYTAIRLARGKDVVLTHEIAAPPGITFAAIGLVSGLLSGLLGIGGGSTLVVGFAQVANFTPRRAAATSLACVGILALPSTITHAVLGNIDWRFALLLTAGVIPGAHLGSALAMRTRDHRFRMGLAYFNATVAIAYGSGELIALYK